MDERSPAKCPAILGDDGKPGGIIDGRQGGLVLGHIREWEPTAPLTDQKSPPDNFQNDTPGGEAQFPMKARRMESGRSAFPASACRLHIRTY
jgi:hypothetical protein